MIHQRMSQGHIRRARDLRLGSGASWAEHHGGRMELRGHRELMTLATAMDLVSGQQGSFQQRQHESSTGLATQCSQPKLQANYHPLATQHGE